MRKESVFNKREKKEEGGFGFKLGTCVYIGSIPQKDERLLK